MGTLAGGDMDTHTGAAEQQGSFVIALGDLCAHAQSHSVEHQVGIIGVAVLPNAKVKDLPALLGQMLYNDFLQGETGEVSANYQIFVFYGFHFLLPPVLFVISLF
jgi:hypothetical protein